MQLRQIGLSDDERAGMQGELLRRVGKRRPDLEAFSAWLDAQPAFDVLLDGPNPSPNPNPNPDPNPHPNPNLT